MKLESKPLRFNQIYRGLVVDNDDPNKTGRVRVRVHCVFDDVTNSHLPWAVPCLPIFTGAGSGHGWFAVPEVNSEVFVFFEEGDFYQPVYFGEAVTGVHGHPEDGDVNYPNRRGFKTKAGHTIWMDDAADEIRVKHSVGSFFSMKSDILRMNHKGATIKIDDSGNIVISGTKVDINP